MKDFQMIDVGDKLVTARGAVAEGRIRMSRVAFVAVKERRLEKGDALAMAQVAGILAAKRTAELLPLCHPLPLDTVEVRYALEEETSAVRIECEAKAHAKTGVEMEALTAVNIALLTIYDLVKAIDPAPSLSDIRLLRKVGGKSDVGRPLNEEQVSVITVSDRVMKGERTDTSGPLLVTFLESLGAVVTHETVADDRDALTTLLKQVAKRARLIVTSGGTGLSPRDITPETITALCDRLAPGIGEALRHSGSTHGERAWLSRQVAGLIGGCLVVALPGSEKAVKQALPLLVRLLPHALHIARGGNHDAPLP
jgi:molybdenum cofactor biosynthesis protein MoaC